MARGVEDWLRRNTGELSEVMKILYTLTYTSSCNHLTSHQTAHLKSEHVIEHKLKLNKVDETNHILLMLKDLSQNTQLVSSRPRPGVRTSSPRLPNHPLLVQPLCT